MKFTIILFFLTASTFGKIISSRKNHHDSGIDDLGWLFDGENNEVEDDKFTVCDTDDCKALAKELLRGVNESVDPCENFYEFSCGTWKKHHPIPPYTAVWGRPYMFQQMVYHRLKGILETKPKPDDILPVRQAKKWYRSCMNTEALEKRGLKPIESILMQVGGWPMTIDAEEWDENEHPWQRIEQHYFQITGSYVFYKFSPLWYRESTIEMMKGDLPLLNKLPFKFQNYTGDEYENYKDFISSVIQMFVEHNSANISHKMIEKDVRDLIAFEKQLAMIPEYDDEPEMTFEEFQEWYDEKTVDKGNKIIVKKLINQLLEMVNHDVDEFSNVTADSLDYFVQLNDLLNETPKRTIVNYIHWHFVSDMLAATTEKMRDIFFTLMENEFGVKEREPRWIECTKEMKMVKATAYAFSSKYFSKEVDTNVRDMVDHIRAEMKLQIEKSDWLDDATKKIATDKLQNMGLLVGTPAWYKNSTHVLNSYKGLVIGIDHFDNVLSYKKYEVREKLRKSLTNEVPVEDDEVDPLVVNAYYDPHANHMALPAADLQPPFFTVNLPHNVNYGMIGAAIGHEIGHAYDVNGLRIGLAEENLKLSEHIMDMYFKRAECFIDQFNNYFGVTEPEYDGTTPGYEKWSLARRAQGENMADTTGLQAAFEAWKKLIEKNGPDSRLPGFEKYSNEQMFFIGFGSLWCMESTEEYAAALKEQDEHSPMNLRVLGAVSNTNDFARVFNCPKGSPMNPDNKCNIWKTIEAHTAHKKANRGRKHKKHHPWVLNW